MNDLYAQAILRITKGSAQALFLLVILLAIPNGSDVQAQENTKSVLITGTSTGIGLRMTELLSSNGFFVYAGARNDEDYARLNAMDNVQAVQLDVTIQSEIDAAVEFISSEGRGLYGLVNNAGVAVMGPLIEMSEEDMQFQMDVNLFGPYRVTKAFAGLIIESEGRIMTTSSISGILAGRFLGAYAMSKHGIEAYTDALAAEMSALNIKVAAVEPGNYKSQIFATMVERMEAKGGNNENSRFSFSVDALPRPLDRSQYKEPDDVAQAALHFMSNDMPKRRYMVVPNQREAEITIRQALREMIQLNHGQPFSYSRDELIEMLDEVMQEVETANN